MSDKSFRESVEVTRIRNIGHLVLAASGDSISRVMPIQALSDGAYKISFEKAFVPNPDSLILTTMQQLDVAARYSIELLETNTGNMVYSFVVSNRSGKTILPCQSRPLPSNNYDIIIRFDKKSPILSYPVLGVVLLLLMIAGWLLYKPSRAKLPTPEIIPPSYVAIGAIQFYPDQQKIICGNDVTELTAKETAVLTLLSQNLNSMVERTRLQKEIWEDQGVIVNRSLDIFVSRLRKKLLPDTNVKIVNVHSKGYKLEVINDSQQLPA